jgi:hypothetical protein
VTPQIRANWTKMAIRKLRRMPGPGRDVVLHQLGDETLRQIQSAGMLGWLPAGVHGRLFDVLHEALGSQRAVTFWEEMLSANFDTPVLRPLVQGAIGLFGMTPYSIVRMSPSAWSLVARDCGDQSVRRGSERIHLILEVYDLPPVLASPGYVDHCYGNFQAALRFVNQRGEVTLAAADPATGRYTFRLSDVR